LFIFLYFVSLSPFILELLFLVDCGDLDTKYKNINTHIENPQYTRHKRSNIKGDKDTKYKNINTHIRNPQSPFILDLLCLVYCGFSMCVFIFLYFVSRSPFILDLFWLVYCEFLGFCLYSCILDTKYKNINTHIRNPQSTRHKRSKIKGDLDTKYKNINTNRGIHSPQETRVVYILVFCIFITFYFRSLVSCGLWVPMFLFIFLYFVSLSQIKGDKDTKYKNINKNIGTHSTQDTRDLK
jgi:hypothetical protein